MIDIPSDKLNSKNACPGTHKIYNFKINIFFVIISEYLISVIYAGE